MLRSWFVLFGILMITSSSTCNKENEHCEKFQRVPARIIEGPASGSVTQDIPLMVTFGVFNGCGQFGKFEDSETGYTRNINVIARYSGCVCTDDLPSRIATYNFKTSQPGVYYLHFWSSDSTVVSDTLNIE